MIRGFRRQDSSKARGCRIAVIIGYGYGPGIGEGFDKVIMIISRASGAPVIAGAVEYASQLIEANVLNIAEKEFEAEAGKTQ